MYYEREVEKMITFRRSLVALLTVLVLLSGTALASISYTLSSIQNPSSIYTGDSVTVSFSITNNNWLYAGKCKYKLDSGSWSAEFDVSNGATVTKSVIVQAPSEGSGSGSVSHTVTSSCYEPAYGGDPTPVEKYTTFTLFYDDSRYEARTAINSAQSAINSAQSSINNLQNKINDAKNLGADVSLEESKLLSAKNSIQSAQSKLSTANSLNVPPNYNQAKNTANEAKSYADSAKTDADNAYPTANQKYTDAVNAKNSAQNAMNSAKKAIDSASTSKAEAQIAINEAKNVCPAVGSAQTSLDIAISKLDSANTKYSEANTYFTSKKWNDAKTSASQAESYANDALTNAGNAKSTANQAKETCRSEEGQTKLKLDTAQTTYNNVVDNVDKTKDAITLLSSIGVETSEFTKELEKVSSTLVDAKAELDKAKTRYENKEFSESKTYSAKSLDITEKDTTILNDNGKKMELALKDKFTKRYSSANKSYDDAVRALEESKAKISGEVYVAKKEKLDNARKKLENASNLMSNPKTLADIKGAFLELDQADLITTELIPKSSVPSFEAIFALFGISIVYLVSLRRKRISA